MADRPELRDPWLVAVWPGMGNVGLNAGVYLLANLDMQALAEIESGDLFELNHVEVKDGIIQPTRQPRNRLFVWSDPKAERDLVLLLGEAQPPVGQSAFCRRVVAYARELGVQRAFTFAAMATDMRPEAPARVFVAATDSEGLEELQRLDTTVLESGQIGGLNGVLLGAAAQAGLRGACLLGEMPHVFHRLPFPKGSLAVLEAFTALTGIEVDLAQLEEQARVSERQLSELLARVEGQLRGESPEEEEEAPLPPPAEVEQGLSASDERRLERLFKQAEADRSRAFELKQELDRLGVFKEYEDRFLDLFKRPGAGQP